MSRRLWSFNVSSSERTPLFHRCFNSSSYVRYKPVKKSHNWIKPEGYDTGITVFNSLSNSKERLILRDKSQLTWYTCGPTVYDLPHLGHARTYVSLDIIRRILTQYFNINVVQVMGITDVDDKIIKRAREADIPFPRMTAQYEGEFIEDMNRLGVLMPTHLTRVSDYVGDIVACVETLIQRGYAYVSGGSVYFDTEKLGERYGKLQPSSVRQPTPVSESSYQTDSLALKDLFNVDDLSADSGNYHSDKKQLYDFALWRKATNLQEGWPSPWSFGRPGWHTECATMASSVFGQNMDIHSGGADLIFPHHENEIAIVEAAHNTQQWTNYFLHTGPLLIKGKKMSKSVKNFTSVREFLRTYRATQFRFFCLLYRYSHTVELHDDRIHQAGQIEERFSSFFLNCSSHIRYVLARPQLPKRWTKSEYNLYNSFDNTRSIVDAALRNDFDTPTVLRQLLNLAHITSSYMQQAPYEKVRNVQPPELIESIMMYVAGMLDLFGVSLRTEWQHLTVNYSDDVSVFGTSGSDSAIDVSREDNPIIDALVQFRSEVRKLARSAGSKNPETAERAASTLRRCDKLRDDLHQRFGLRIEDHASGDALWKLVPLIKSSS